MLRSIKLIALVFLFFPTHGQDSQVYVTKTGSVHFTSDAPLELIEAETGKLVGALNIVDRSFSFQVLTSSFNGFNSSLQRIHFNEDFLESDLYPNSTFKGKIIEEIDLSKEGNYTIRAKGKLSIHGIENDRIIRCKITVKDRSIVVNSEFTVFINDHNITVPSILNKKIAEEITVDIKLTMVSE